MAKFSLQIQGQDELPNVIGDTIYISETGDGSNSTLTFTMWDRGNPPLGTPPSWLARLSHDVLFQDLTNARPLFKGNLVNVVRRQTDGRRYFDCTAIGYNAWLSRLYIPKWTSTKSNGTPIASDRNMISNVTSALAGAGGAFAYDFSNTYVNETNTQMPKVTVTSGTLGQILQAIADSASTTSDPTTRRFYIGQDHYLHYYKGTENLTAPYIVGDANYVADVTGTSGLVSLWALADQGGTAVDAEGYAAGTLHGTYTQGQTTLAPNTLVSPATKFDGSSAYISAAGANLTPGNTFSLECWFQRAGGFAANQTLIAGAANDYQVRFNTSNQIELQKSGSGVVFHTTAAFTDTTAHHLLVTKSSATTHVYVDGVDKAGTTTDKTIVASSSINIGRDLASTSQFFNGTLQYVAVYNVALSSATAAKRYLDGWTITPYEFEFETDVNSSGTRVYLLGTSASQWYANGANSNYQQSFSYDTQQALTPAKATAIGQAYLKEQAPVLYGGRFKVSLWDGWRANQAIQINNATLGIDGSDPNIATTYQIRQVDTTFELGSGQRTYEISFGALPWSGTFDVQRKQRN